MKKRLLCYDEDNPVGIDENGVLNPSALGGGEPDLVISSNMDALISTGGYEPSNKSELCIESGSIIDVVRKFEAGEEVNVVYKKEYFYAGEYLYKEYLKATHIRLSKDYPYINFNFMFMCDDDYFKVMKVKIKHNTNEIYEVVVRGITL